MAVGQVAGSELRFSRKFGSRGSEVRRPLNGVWMDVLSGNRQYPSGKSRYRDAFNCKVVALVNRDRFGAGHLLIRNSGQEIRQKYGWGLDNDFQNFDPSGTCSFERRADMDLVPTALVRRLLQWR